jgi:hypothetical protein
MLRSRTVAIGIVGHHQSYIITIKQLETKEHHQRQQPAVADNKISSSIL